MGDAQDDGDGDDSNDIDYIEGCASDGGTSITTTGGSRDTKSDELTEADELTIGGMVEIHNEYSITSMTSALALRLPDKHSDCPMCISL